MNNDNHESDNRIRKYTFDDTITQSDNKNPNNRIWPIIILIVVISALILGGVKAITYFTADTTPQTTQTANSNSYQNSTQPQHNAEKNNKTRTTKSQSNEPKKQNHKNNSSFAETHIFSSVADAQSYAKTTQSQWIQAGYQTYTVSADSQGYYILKFVK